MCLQLNRIVLFVAAVVVFHAAAEATPQSSIQLDVEKEAILCPLEAAEYSLAELLPKIARRMGKSALVDDRVRGFVVGRGDFVACSDLLEFVEAVFDLVIYDDGKVFHVATTDKLESAIIELPGGNSALFIGQLRSMGLVHDDQLPRPTSDGKAIYISGHPQYIKIVRDLANTKYVEHNTKVKILFGGK